VSFLTDIHITHNVTLAGSAFGFLVLVTVLGLGYFKNGRKFKFLKRKQNWVPFAIGLTVMVLASATTGGALGIASGFATGTGNQGGALVSRGMVGGNGSADIAQHGHLSFQGSIIALALLILAGLFLWFAKKLGERLLILAGAVVGATWGLTISLGGIAAFTGVPLANWAGSLLIG
jgi:hypothetical protein